MPSALIAKTTGVRGVRVEGNAFAAAGVGQFTQNHLPSGSRPKCERETEFEKSVRVGKDQVSPLSLLSLTPIRVCNSFLSIIQIVPSLFWKWLASLK